MLADWRRSLVQKVCSTGSRPARSLCALVCASSSALARVKRKAEEVLVRGGYSSAWRSFLRRMSGEAGLKRKSLSRLWFSRSMKVISTS